VFDPRDRTPFDVAKEMFPGDQPTTQILRAATSPATTTGTGWASDLASVAMIDFLVGLAPLSAGARLMQLGMQAPMTSHAAVLIPVRREKIRAYINRELGAESSRADKIIIKAYSGFVHAASPHIMDMYGGVPPRFDVSGEFRRLRSGEHADDALNYFYRALLSMALAGKAFGDEELFTEMRAEAAKLEEKIKARRAAR